MTHIWISVVIEQLYFTIVQLYPDIS